MSVRDLMKNGQYCLAHSIIELVLTENHFVSKKFSLFIHERAFCDYDFYLIAELSVRSRIGWKQCATVAS